jgi:glycosyltransferase involved in cell wall biosynthesis
MEKVSVILTTFNAEKTIQTTLDSILNQSGLNSEFHFELLIVDDCSTDLTTQILKQNGVNFFVTDVNSGGPNKGRNIGLKKATGDYICFIDHDDIWDSQKTRQQLKVIKKVPIVSSGYKVVDKKNEKIINRFNHASEVVYYDKNQTFLNKLSRSKEGQAAYFSSIMIRKELKNILFEENFGMLDFDWVLRLFENQESAELSECLMTRFVNSDNLSLNINYRLKDYYYSLYILEKYQSQYKKQVELAIKRTHGSRARYHYLINEMDAARKYFKQSAFEMKNLAYIITTYFGSGIIRKYFNVFG